VCKILTLKFSYLPPAADPIVSTRVMRAIALALLASAVLAFPHHFTNGSEIEIPWLQHRETGCIALNDCPGDKTPPISSSSLLLAATTTHATPSPTPSAAGGSSSPQLIRVIALALLASAALAFPHHATS